MNNYCIIKLERIVDALSYKTNAPLHKTGISYLIADCSANPKTDVYLDEPRLEAIIPLGNVPPPPPIEEIRAADEQGKMHIAQLLWDATKAGLSWGARKRADLFGGVISTPPTKSYDRQEAAKLVAELLKRQHKVFFPDGQGYGVIHFRKWSVHGHPFFGNSRGKTYWPSAEIGPVPGVLGNAFAVPRPYAITLEREVEAWSNGLCKSAWGIGTSAERTLAQLSIPWLVWFINEGLRLEAGRLWLGDVECRLDKVVELRANFLEDWAEALALRNDPVRHRTAMLEACEPLSLEIKISQQQQPKTEESLKEPSHPEVCRISSPITPAPLGAPKLDPKIQGPKDESRKAEVDMYELRRQQDHAAEVPRWLMSQLEKAIHDGDSAMVRTIFENVAWIGIIQKEYPSHLERARAAAMTKGWLQPASAEAATISGKTLQRQVEAQEQRERTSEGNWKMGELELALFKGNAALVQAMFANRAWLAKMGKTCPNRLREGRIEAVEKGWLQPLQEFTQTVETTKKATLASPLPPVQKIPAPQASKPLVQNFAKETTEKNATLKGISLGEEGRTR